VKKNLFVTMADSRYVDQAKQLFSSVYLNGNWSGDYLLLALDVSEEKLQWFREKRILIKKVNLIFDKNKWFSILPSQCTLPPIMAVKFHLFTKEFKKWEKIVYMDSDIIVNFPIDELTRVNKFGAVKDIYAKTIMGQIPNEYKKEMLLKLKKKIRLKSPSFNAGVFSFDTKVIAESSFEDLKKLFLEFGNLSLFGDQLIFNIYFYKRWKKFSLLYNLLYIHLITHFGINKKDIESVIHFAGPQKPWEIHNPYYDLWKNNFNASENLNFKEKMDLKGKKSFIKLKKFFCFLKGFLICDVIYFLFGSKRSDRGWFKLVFKVFNKTFSLVANLLWMAAKIMSRITLFIANRAYFKTFQSLFFKLDRCIWKIAQVLHDIIHSCEAFVYRFLLWIEKEIIYLNMLYSLNKKLFLTLNFLENSIISILLSPGTILYRKKLIKNRDYSVTD
jgi:lipopolysaccharide biosynthesis glycosyltransferase